MKRTLLAIFASSVALGIGAGTAVAGNGQAQAAGQSADTSQTANAVANGLQNAVNANVPVSIAGGSIVGGTSSANQTASNSGSATASNNSGTNQTASATQAGGSSSCQLGCGGAGQFQAVGQSAHTGQTANATGNANQNAVNANVPVSIAGGSIVGGTSSANQTASNSGSATASNNSGTNQTASATQAGGSSSCQLGCGGAGQFQALTQDAQTWQSANASATGTQNAVNGNAPVSIAGGNIAGGSSTANQAATNSGFATGSNSSGTNQTASATQAGGSSSCQLGCGAPGQFQAVGQAAHTGQWANATGNANQTAVNGNAPVSIAGGDIAGGSSAASQNASNTGYASTSNSGGTNQTASASQAGGRGSSCQLGCGGAAQFQGLTQDAQTWQWANASATGTQNAVNGNAPVSIAGGNIAGGSSSATQNAVNGASATATNTSSTNQFGVASQVGGGSSCQLGCGGAGQFQAVSQAAHTGQWANATGNANQTAVNGNAPVSIAGGDIAGGSSAASQNASNSGYAFASNSSGTNQTASASQAGGSGSCQLGCGGAGQFQALAQDAHTGQWANAYANADQNAVNSNAPVCIAGGNIACGSSSANQNAVNGATAVATNTSTTNQSGVATQTGGGGAPAASPPLSPPVTPQSGGGEAPQVETGGPLFGELSARGGSLPFTGLNLLWLLLFASALILSGTTLRVVSVQRGW
jgi:hypothetical protein